MKLARNMVQDKSIGGKHSAVLTHKIKHETKLLPEQAFEALKHFVIPTGSESTGPAL